MPNPNCKRCGGMGVVIGTGSRTYGEQCSCAWAAKALPSPESRLDALERRQRMLAGLGLVALGMSSTGPVGAVQEGLRLLGVDSHPDYVRAGDGAYAVMRAIVEEFK